MSEPTKTTPRFQFRSDLSQTPLAEILVTIHRYRVPGVVVCERDGETKKIFIDHGTIIFATSTNVVDSLGDRLLQQGVITEEQYRESVRRLVQGNGKRQGAILVEMRALEPKALFLAVREQVEAIVWSLFDWHSGSVVFEPGLDRSQEFIKLSVPTPRAVVDGVLRVADAKPLVARLGNKTTLFDRAPENETGELVLAENEKALLDGVDGKRTLVELIALPANPPATNAKLLYAFFALKLIVVRQPKQIIKVQVRGR